jgi:poly(3-hydroxybutyrate) depolymerase
MIGKQWNDGRVFIQNVIQRRNRGEESDDIKFISELISKLKMNYFIDEKKIFATGISNGGIMCYKIANELSHLVSGIATIASSMSEIQHQSYKFANVQKNFKFLNFF